MSAQPTVCAICLTKDRPEMLARAVRSFQAQTYENKRLIIYDSSAEHPTLSRIPERGVHIHTKLGVRSIGRLRNAANEYSEADILVHFDDDDVSHSNRIAEQVALLQSSGADVVGYSNLLFWREAEQEAWLYSARDAGYAPGTSLAYWRRTWERKPFPDISNGEDNEWLRWLKLERESSLPEILNLVQMPEGHMKPIGRTPSMQPRLIASIHAGNTSDSYRTLLAVNCEQRDHYFRRVPEYDSVCREAMQL